MKISNEFILNGFAYASLKKYLRMISVLIFLLLIACSIIFFIFLNLYSIKEGVYIKNKTDHNIYIRSMSVNGEVVSIKKLEIPIYGKPYFGGILYDAGDFDRGDKVAFELSDDGMAYKIVSGMFYHRDDPPCAFRVTYEGENKILINCDSFNDMRH